MDIQAIFIYCLCSELLISINYKDDSQCKMNSAELMTFVIISAIHYQCNYSKTKLVLSHFRYFTHILSLSQLVRRIHRIPEHVWLLAFHMCQQVLTVKNSTEYIIDSFPVPCCQNNKIFRCKIFQGKKYHGYTASKKSYFFGIKVHMITDLNGIPIEFIFTPGSVNDIKSLAYFEFDLKNGSRIYADKAYNDYLQEDILKESNNIKFIPKRKINSKRKNDLFDDFLLSINRNRIETTFSRIINLMPRCIRAVTTQGFVLKVFLFILGYMIRRIDPYAATHLF